MSTLLTVQFIECSVDVLRCVAFLVRKDQSNQLWFNVIICWYYYVDAILYAVFF